MNSRFQVLYILLAFLLTACIETNDGTLAEQCDKQSTDSLACADQNDNGTRTPEDDGTGGTGIKDPAVGGGGISDPVGGGGIVDPTDPVGGGGGTTDPVPGTGGNIVENQYHYPIGVPQISWDGPDPVNTPSPQRPAQWPSTAVEGYYYIDPSHTAATDSQNPWGSPDVPRASFPPNPIAAGSYIELGGDGFSGNYRLRFSCTAELPCWLRGDSADSMPTISGAIILEDAKYLYAEYLNFDGGTNGAVSIIGVDSHHVALRHSFVQNRAYANHTSGIGITPNDGGLIHDIVVYNSTFRELGVWQNSKDQDFHGVTPNLGNHSAPTELHSVWILNNKFYHISGNGVQVVAGIGDGFERLHHIYIGNNHAYDNRQAGFWSKQSSDVIISQNVSSGGRLFGGAMGDSIGFQYGPDNLWIIYNTLHDSNFGIRQSDTGSLPSHKAYIVGNMIYDIHPQQGYAYSPDDFLRPGVGISLWHGGMQRFVVDNTIVDVEGGISLVFDGPATLSGNIIANINDSDYFVSAFLAGRNGSVALDHLLFYDDSGIERFRWDSNKYYSSLESFRIATSQCLIECIKGDPKFVAPASNPPDLQIQAGSAAQNPNPNRALDVYQVFFDRYGLDIRRDFSGKVRPQGGSQDYGAFEISE